MRWKEYEDKFKAGFDNGVLVEVLKEGTDFAGLGQVQWGRRKLRSDELPIMPLITTPNGYVVRRLEFEEVQKEGEEIVISLAPHVAPVGRMEWLCYDGQDRWNVGTWGQDPVRDRGGMLQVALAPVQREIAGVSFVGFSYAYRFRSRKYHVYRIHDRATWELGGWATGNSFWMHGPFNDPQKTIQNKQDAFTTAWVGEDAEGQALQLQQFLPLFTHLQGFGFQFDAHSLLLTAFEEVFHCRSLFQKEEGRNCLVHWHQLCSDLAGLVEFPPLQVLCVDRESEDQADMANLYSAIRNELQAQYRGQTGVSPERAEPGGCLDGACPDERSMERGMDSLAGAACKRVFVPHLLEVNAPEDETVAAGRQAEKRARKVIEDMHSRALEAYLSLADCCAGWVLADSLEGEEPVAAGAALVAEALRDQETWDRLLEHMRKLKKEFGVDGLFAADVLRSVADDLAWVGQPGRNRIARSSGTIRSLQARRIKLVKALQQMGYRCTVRGLGGLDTPGRAVPYEYIAGREYMFRDAALRFPAEQISEEGDDLVEAFFRGCANRVAYTLPCRVNTARRDGLPEWWEDSFAAINRASQAVREYMERGCLLPGGRGVLWRGGAPDVTVLWAYKDFARKVEPRCEVFDVIASEPVEVEEEGNQFQAEQCCVYLIQCTEPAEEAS